MTQTVSAQDARNKFAEILNTAVYGKTNIVITRFNKPQAVLMEYKHYEFLTDPSKRFTKKEWGKEFKVLDRIRNKIPKIDPKVLEREIERAVQEVRAEKRNKHDPCGT